MTCGSTPDLLAARASSTANVGAITETIANRPTVSSAFRIGMCKRFSFISRIDTKNHAVRPQY